VTSALIGHTGFVGGNLARQMHFDEFYNSKNIEETRGRSFDLVVCAGAPGAKWYANAHPAEDAQSLLRLYIAACHLTTETFVLISTVDAIHPRDSYGQLRNDLEACFGGSIAIRLPALFGSGMKKNALYDLMTSQRLAEIAPNAAYQWYPLRRLGADIGRVRELGLRTVNFTSEPIAMEEIRARFFPHQMIGSPSDTAPAYNVEGDPAFRLTRAEVFDEMGEFLAGND
jgi:hypothetical protein